MRINDCGSRGIIASSDYRAVAIGGGAAHAELLFIDPQVDDLQGLLSNLRTCVEPVMLDSDAPAAAQIAALLQLRSDVRIVHIMAHGSPGRVHFASGDWSTTSVLRDMGSFAEIGECLGVGGELRLWSCESGAAESGGEFIQMLEQATGIAVCASATPVGAAALGGTWWLGRHQARPPLTQVGVGSYAGVLAPEITVTGSIANGPTTANVTYFVVDRGRNAVVGNITLPDASTVSHAFRLNVQVPNPSGSLDVGSFDDSGKFVSAGFTVEGGQLPAGAVGPQG